MQVIITYSDEAYAKLAAYANANSKTLEQYLRSNLSWAAKQFISVDVIPNAATEKPAQEPLKAENSETVDSGDPWDNAEVYVSDKPAKPKGKKRKVKTKTPS